MTDPATDAAESPAILLDSQPDGVSTITLNRPARHNSLEVDELRAFSAALAEAAAARPRALIITGAGEKTFCAGASLGDVGGAGGKAFDGGANPLTHLCDDIEMFPAPTICALNGGVYGGGVEMALACDFRVGGKRMKAFVPPARLGIHYEPAGIARAMRVVGLQAARRMFLLVETFDAETLERIGFLDRLVEKTEIAATALAMAETIAGYAPMAVQGMCRTLDELSRDALDERAARKRIAACWGSEDLREGLAAMKEKRAPQFKGR